MLNNNWSLKGCVLQIVNNDFRQNLISFEKAMFELRVVILKNL